MKREASPNSGSWLQLGRSSRYDSQRAASLSKARRRYRLRKQDVIRLWKRIDVPSLSLSPLSFSLGNRQLKNKQRPRGSPARQAPIARGYLRSGKLPAFSVRYHPIPVDRYTGRSRSLGHKALQLVFLFATSPPSRRDGGRIRESASAARRCGIDYWYQRSRLCFVIYPN